MDILAHALWTNILARGAEKRAELRRKKLLNIIWTTFWGVFPDLFAFTIPFVIGIWGWIVGTGFMYGRTAIATGLAPTLYLYSHSLVIWAIVFIVVWAYYKRPRWELLGWALHILIDIPSHANGFYLTPVLFPISDWKFTHGVSWAHPVFMIVNYSTLLTVWGSYFIYRLVQKKKNESVG
jgi:hypothetical protein